MAVLPRVPKGQKPQDFYKGKFLAYPQDAINPKLKLEKKYYLEVNQALYADYINNRLAIPYGSIVGGRTIQELQLYATGRQSPEKIKKWLLKKNKQGQLVAKTNISYDGYAKMPQLLDMMRSKNMSQEFDVRLTCIDEGSVASLEDCREMMKFILDENTRKFVEKAMYKPEMKPDPKELGLQNAADVDNYIDAGGFTLQWQIAAEAACAKSKQESDYKEFQDQVMDDLITNPNGICGTKSYVNPSVKIPMFRRVDMTMALVPPSKYRNFRDITRAGEIRVMTIADIRREHPTKTAQELYDIAMTFQWMNPPLVAWNLDYNSWLTSPVFFSSTDPVMSARVFVLDSQWLSVNIETNIKNERGFFKPVDFEYKLMAKDAKNGDQKLQKKVIKKYYSQWIIGSDTMLDYGVCEDVVYYGPDGNKTPRLDYFFAQTGNMSLVERCVALIDDMNMVLVKHRNLWASIPASPAMAIQQNLIENVMLNDVAQQPEDILQVFMELGVLYYNSLDDNGDPLFMAGGAKPIEFMDLTPLANLMSTCSAELLVKSNELREVLGLQNGADAGQKSPYQGLGETELAFQAANASLQPTFNSYNYLFKDLFTDIIKKWQIVAKDGAVKLPYSVLGVHNMKMLELGSEFTNAEFNVSVSIAPSTEERTAILQDLLQLKQAGSASNGAQGISHAQYLFLYEKVMAGQIKAAYFVLSKIEAQQRAEARVQQVQDQQMNIQSQQGSAQVKGQMDTQLAEAKGEQQRLNTLLQGVINQNTEILKLVLAAKSEASTPVSAEVAAPILQNNNATVSQVMSTEGQQDAEQGQPESVPQEAPMQEAEMPVQ